MAGPIPTPVEALAEAKATLAGYVRAARTRIDLAEQSIASDLARIERLKREIATWKAKAADLDRAIKILETPQQDMTP